MTNIQNTALFHHSYQKTNWNPLTDTKLLNHNSDITEHATTSQLSVVAQQITPDIGHTSYCTNNDLSYVVLLVSCLS
jgi:hypothetical protein